MFFHLPKSHCKWYFNIYDVGDNGDNDDDIGDDDNDGGDDDGGGDISDDDGGGDDDSSSRPASIMVDPAAGPEVRLSLPGNWSLDNI